MATIYAWSLVWEKTSSRGKICDPISTHGEGDTTPGVIYACFFRNLVCGRHFSPPAFFASFPGGKLAANPLADWLYKTPTSLDNSCILSLNLAVVGNCGYLWIYL
jgi:hypothetical protein